MKNYYKRIVLFFGLLLSLSTFGQIVANDDVTTYNGNGGDVTFTNVLANDTLNGSFVNASQVTVTFISSTSPSVILSGANVIIAAGTPNGTYTLTYQICEVTNPNNCDTAVVSITVGADSTIIANDDIGTVLNFDTTSIALNNVLSNDTLNGMPVSLNQVIITEISATTPFISLEQNGQVIVSDGPYAGVYSLVYQICEVANPNNCDTANVIVVIENDSTDNINLLNYTSLPRPGFVYQNQILYRNNSNQAIASGTITFTKDDLLSITSVSESNAITTATGFTYIFTNLLPNEERIISVSMQVPTIPTVNLGDLLTNVATISYFNGTETINQESTLVETIIGSFDPNDKTESHGGKIVHSTFTANDYLTYTIRFENTGTAEAINIRVEDILDEKLDETTVQMVRSSHPFQLDRIENNLEWSLNGINLPPSIPNDEITGHGYIVFQVKPKPGYTIGDIIPNSASIYFDFNPAIVTEPCLTEFVNALSTNTFALNDLQLYPNPVKNRVSISNSSIIDTVAIKSVLGQEILRKSVNNLQTEIDLSSFANGIYFVKVNANKQERTIKIVKE